jgi:hypothetical protein
MKQIRRDAFLQQNTLRQIRHCLLRNEYFSRKWSALRTMSIAPAYFLFQNGYYYYVCLCCH